MKAARTQNQPKHPLLIPGIGVKTSPTDGFPIEQVALQRWVSGKGSAAGHWSLFGPLRTARELAPLHELERARVLAETDRLVERRRLRALDRVDDAHCVAPSSRSRRSANRHTADASPRRR